MRTLLITLGATVAAITLASAGGASAQAPQLITGAGAPDARLVIGRDIVGDAVLQQAQFLFSGRNYCWYDNGWRGSGYYWCGYAFRRGYGWGGPVGWNGWGRGGEFYRGGGGYRGGGYRGGGYQGGGYRGGNGGGFHGGNVGGGHAGGGHMDGGGHAGGGGHQGGGGEHGGDHGGGDHHH